jgi:hypothetical protein
VWQKRTTIEQVRIENYELFLLREASELTNLRRASKRDASLAKQPINLLVVHISPSSP